MQTRSERKVEPSPRIFRPAVCRVVSQTTWTGLAVAAQCLVPLLAFTPRRLPTDVLNILKLFDDVAPGCCCLWTCRGSVLIMFLLGLGDECAQGPGVRGR